MFIIYNFKKSLYIAWASFRNEYNKCMLFSDGVVSYDVRQGDRRGTDLDLYDFTYDGMIQDNFLLDGLGQLTDGEIGDSNFRLDHQSIGIKGYEWVAWRNDTFDFKGPLQITFKFDSVRNFSSVILNCNNHFTKDIRVFKMALIYFSVGGNLYQNQPVKYDFIRDNAVEYARPVRIRLNHNLGKYVKLHLYYDAKWIMISEIQFHSGEYFSVINIMKILLQILVYCKILVSEKSN